jgi:hypothetical protein
MKAMILKIIVHSQCRVTRFIRSPRRLLRGAFATLPDPAPSRLLNSNLVDCMTGALRRDLNRSTMNIPSE